MNASHLPSELGFLLYHQHFESLKFSSGKLSTQEWIYSRMGSTLESLDSSILSILCNLRYVN